MNPFAWNDTHSLGLPEIDSEHRALFGIAERLYDDMGTGVGKDGLAGLFARLAAYARFHFENEEALMRRTGFPGYADHRREHEKFSATVSSLERLLETGSVDLPGSLVEFLQSWLGQHVGGSDRRMAEYLVRKRRMSDGGKKKKANE